MNIKTGIDIVSVNRIKEAAQKNPKFINRITTEKEREYLSKKMQIIDNEMFFYNSLAGIFSAKEAIVKALESGFSATIAFHDIEILHLASGAPYATLINNAKSYNKKINSISISISHDNNFAIANCILLLKE